MELLFPVLLIAVFYFLLIRPQQKQRKQMSQMQNTLGVGSQVMTGAGLIGTVVGIDEENDHIILEVAPGVTNTYVRRAVVNVLSSPNDSVDADDETPADDASLDDDHESTSDDRDEIDRALDEIEAATEADSNETSGSSKGSRRSGDDPS